MFSAIKTLYGMDTTATYGYSDDAIQSAQARLDIAFPAVLVAYYRTLTHEQINQSHNRLIAPDELSITDGYLLIYEENQGVCYWGIKMDDVNQDSPPVYVGNSIIGSDALEWMVSHQNLAEFFLDMAFYNGTMGGLHYHANMLDKPISRTALECIAETHTPVHFALADGRQRYFTDGYADIIVLCYDDADTASAVFIGTENQPRFDKLLDLFGFEQWSYVSYDDEDWEDGEDDEDDDENY